MKTNGYQKGMIEVFKGYSPSEDDGDAMLPHRRDELFIGDKDNIKVLIEDLQKWL